MKIEFVDHLGEILKMGGPIAASVMVNDKLLEGLYVDQKVVTDGLGMVMLVKIVDQQFFYILAVDTFNEVFFISKTSYRHMFIEDFVNGNITYFEAFHNQIPALKRVVAFDESHFKRTSCHWCMS